MITTWSICFQLSFAPSVSLISTQGIIPSLYISLIQLIRLKINLSSLIQLIISSIINVYSSENGIILKHKNLSNSGKVKM